MEFLGHTVVLLLIVEEIPCCINLQSQVSLSSNWDHSPFYQVVVKTYYSAYLCETAPTPNPSTEFELRGA